MLENKTVIRIGNVAEPAFGLQSGQTKSVKEIKTIAGKAWFLVSVLLKNRDQITEVWVSETEARITKSLEI